MKWIFKQYKVLIFSLLAVVALVGGTFAYLVASDSPVLNSFRFAKVDTSTHEETGENGKKEVTFRNNDISSVYVRARVVVSGSDIGATNVEYVTSPPETLAANTIYVVYNGDATQWLKPENNDDWFYYQKILPGKADDGTTHATPPLITKVLVGSGVDTTKSFEVDVYEESVLTSETQYDQAKAQAAFSGS